MSEQPERSLASRAITAAGPASVVVGWVATVAMAVVALWVWAGWTRPSVSMVFTGYQMVLLAPAWPIAVLAAWRRRWALAGLSTLVAASHVVFCAPAATADDQPAWVVDAPTFTLLSANVWYQNPILDAVANAVLAADADVIVLNEVRTPQREALIAAGVADRYPTEVFWEGELFGTMLLTRLPVVDSGVDNLGGMGSPWVDLDLDGTTARVHGLHVWAPTNAHRRAQWEDNLAGIVADVDNHPGRAAIYAGDFNTTQWHGPFRTLQAAGLSDAHDQVGAGLSRSWGHARPPLSWLGGLMRLDHALLTDGVFAIDAHNVEIPDSDHRGFRVTVAVKPGVNPPG